MQNNKISLSQEQKQKIQYLQKHTYEVIMNFGQLHITKIQIQNDLKKQNQRYQNLQLQIEKFNDLLKRKYGEGKVDFQTGTYIRK